MIACSSTRRSYSAKAVITPTRWQEVERVYHAAPERSPADPDAFLAKVWGTVAQLSHGAKLGPYRIEAPIGAGGK